MRNLVAVLIHSEAERMNIIIAIIYLHLAHLDVAHINLTWNHL